MVACNEVAAALMEHLCNHDWHGYAQDARYGDGEGSCSVIVGDRTYRLAQGDRDCSSAVCDCWQRALEGTPYEGRLDGATYTGNMRDAFTGSGLFDWKPMGFTAQRGDVYLNEVNHTAMCVSTSPDMLAEFSINSFGGISGDAVGDQTGSESLIRPYYVPWCGWDGILHYVGTESESGNAERPSNLPDPRYRVYTLEDGWLEWMVGLNCSDGCGDDYAGVPGHAIRAVEIAGESLGAGGWFQVWKNNMPLPKGDTGFGVEGVVTGIAVYYATPDPAATGYYEAVYRVAPIGAAYLKWEHDDADNGAGGAGPIDRFQLTLGRV